MPRKDIYILTAGMVPATASPSLAPVGGGEFQFRGDPSSHSPTRVSPGRATAAREWL